MHISRNQGAAVAQFPEFESLQSSLNKGDSLIVPKRDHRGNERDFINLLIKLGKQYVLVIRIHS